MATSLTHDTPRFIIRRALALVEDPRTDAHRLGRLLEGHPDLAAFVMSAARAKVQGRVNIRTVTDAVVYLGYGRLPAILRRYGYAAEEQDEIWRRQIRYGLIED
ncbi:MAG: HDOD domain-containing protein [Bradymonadia bacterium]